MKAEDRSSGSSSESPASPGDREQIADLLHRQQEKVYA